MFSLRARNSGAAGSIGAVESDASPVRTVQSCIFRLGQSLGRVAVADKQDEIQTADKREEALVGKLRLQSMRLCRSTLRLFAVKTMLTSSNKTANPSIEGMPKRLRLSVTPHVKRWASLSTLVASR